MRTPSHPVTSRLSSPWTPSGRRRTIRPSPPCACDTVFPWLQTRHRRLAVDIGGRPLGSQADAHAFSMSFAKVVSSGGSGGAVVLPVDVIHRLRATGRLGPLHGARRSARHGWTRSPRAAGCAHGAEAGRTRPSTQSWSTLSPGGSTASDRGRRPCVGPLGCQVHRSGPGPAGQGARGLGDRHEAVLRPGAPSPVVAGPTRRSHLGLSSPSCCTEKRSPCQCRPN